MLLPRPRLYADKRGSGFCWVQFEALTDKAFRNADAVADTAKIRTLCDELARRATEGTLQRLREDANNPKAHLHDYDFDSTVKALGAKPAGQ